MRKLVPVLGLFVLNVSLIAQSQPGSQGTPLRVSGATMSRQLVKRIDGVFPQDGKNHARSAEVQLYALIGADGTVVEADPLNGPPELGRAAIAAARQWIFKPYMVLNRAAPVQTTITVSFGEVASDAIAKADRPLAAPLPAAQGAIQLPLPTAPATFAPAVKATATATDSTKRVEISGSAPRPSSSAAAPLISSTISQVSSQPSPAFPVTQAAEQHAPHFAALPSFQLPRTVGSTNFPGEGPASAASSNLSSRNLLRRVPPEYPADAESKEIEGVVSVEFAVRPDGTVHRPVALSGPLELRQAAIDAIAQWKYTPLPAAIEDEKTTASVDFKLEGPARVPTEVMAGRIEENQLPIYPASALAGGVHGKVTMHALIGRQGQVERLDFVSGPDVLREAAMIAVRNWRYKPYKRDGADVEVDTSIIVDFSLPAEVHLQ